MLGYDGRLIKLKLLCGEEVSNGLGDEDGLLGIESEGSSLGVRPITSQGQVSVNEGNRGDKKTGSNLRGNEKLSPSAREEEAFLPKGKEGEGVEKLLVVPKDSTSGKQAAEEPR